MADKNDIGKTGEPFVMPIEWGKFPHFAPFNRHHKRLTCLADIVFVSHWSLRTFVLRYDLIRLSCRLVRFATFSHALIGPPLTFTLAPSSDVSVRTKLHRASFC